MGRNLVLCSDGTGNTFDGRVTNVTRLIHCLDLSDTASQYVVYDQGVGTGARRASFVETLDPAFKHLPSSAPAWPPRSWIHRARALTVGAGLRRNVEELYCDLARTYRDGDRVFLFGFSRGAFTVRALAGLIHRCHLAEPDSDDHIRSRFNKSWDLFVPTDRANLQPVMDGDTEAIEVVRRSNRPCRIHFLGLWDTVKSYGGIKPVILPHLRHNPDVMHVRHALALDETRAWFAATTWGVLDSDDIGEMKRISESERIVLKSQDVREVWFTGTHSGVGGADRKLMQTQPHIPRSATARIALRWMLGEAVNITDPIQLNEAGRTLLASADPDTVLEREPMRRLTAFGWWLSERIPRQVIENSGEYPVLKPPPPGDGMRDPGSLTRCGVIAVHETVPRIRRPEGPVTLCGTQPAPDGSTISTKSTATRAESARIAWLDFNERQRFEHELIDRKTTWLLTTQAILIAAYGFTLDAGTQNDLAKQFRNLVAWAGIAVASLALIGLLALINSKRLSFKDYSRHFEKDLTSLPEPLNERKLQWGVRTWNTRISLAPDAFMAIVFIVLWGRVLSRHS